MMKEALEALLAEALAAPVQATSLQRLTGGATKQTWRLEARVGAASQAGTDRTADATSSSVPLQRFIVQLTPASKLGSVALDDSGERSAPRSIDPQQDAALTRLARAQGVPAPEVVALIPASHELGMGQITRFVAGETLAPRILREARYENARARLPAQCAQALAGIHRIAPADVPFLALKDARYQWRENRALVDAHGLKVPALEWGLRWIEERLGTQGSRPAAVIHGDFRLGNLIVDEQGLACVIDWELAALCDPMQDLAWLCLRTWRFGGARPVAGVGDREAFYEAYAQASGAAVDPAQVFFWEVFCQIRWAVMCLTMGMGPVGGDPEAVSLEHRLIGRRMEEPLWDMVRMIRAQGDR